MREEQLRNGREAFGFENGEACNGVLREIARLKSLL